MSNRNKKGVNIVSFNMMNDAPDNVRCGAAFLRPFDADATADAHSNRLNPADVIYSKANNDVKQPTTIKLNTPINSDKKVSS